jgi:Pyruvate/2-oxoacid:ferredoxin oxidoreductase delta subunit
VATMITNDCINCGACEPECPNNAITQSEDLYVIDPLLCTECVGFHDYEACAAVCPADCCVTDPNNVEIEAALIGRARTIHADTSFGDQFESRFRKGGEKPAATPAAKKTEGRAVSATSAVSQEAAIPSSGSVQAAALLENEDLAARLPRLPEVEDWRIPVRCFRCAKTYDVPARQFMIGNVLFCPHCQKSLVVKDTLSFQIRTALKEAYEGWRNARANLETKRERELKEFLEKRDREIQEIIESERRSVEKLKDQLNMITESYDAPGRPAKKRSLLGWG